MRTRLLLALSMLSIMLSGCILAGGAVAYGVLVAAADKGVRFQYHAPYPRVHEALDDFLKEEGVVVQDLADADGLSFRSGRTSDDRRFRAELRRYDDSTTMVFFRVGVSGDTYVGHQLHDRFAARLGLH